MSIILKGIDMPEICELCPFWVMRTDGRWCRTLHKIVDISKDRADDCPLVEISTPHGRLIDADELVKHLRKDPLFDLVERYGISGVIESRPTILDKERE